MSPTWHGATIGAAAPLGFEVINLGSSAPVELREALALIEECLGRRATILPQPVQRVDVRATWADIGKARRLLGWEPTTALQEGIERMVKWYLDNRSGPASLCFPDGGAEQARQARLARPNSLTCPVGAHGSRLSASFGNPNRSSPPASARRSPVSLPTVPKRAALLAQRAGPEGLPGTPGG